MTSYEKVTETDKTNKAINIYKNLGDVFISDAFGCAHRKHMSIYGIKDFNDTIGYGHLMKKEIDAYYVQATVL